MSGLKKVLRAFGQMKVKGEDGKTVLWVWDYATEQPRIKSEMTADEIAASERAKYEKIKSNLP